MEKDKKDLKPEEATSVGEGQPEKKTEPPAGDETLKNEVEGLKEELAKAKSDLTNYKTAFFIQKTKDLTLEEEEEVKPITPVATIPPTEAVGGEEESWKEVDRRAGQIAEQKLETRSKVETKQNEKIAIRKFATEHPEVNETIWPEIKDNYANKHGKSVEGILLDLNRSLILYKVENKIPLEGKKSETGEEKLASLGGTTVKTASVTEEFNEAEKKIMTEQGILPENFKKWRERVLSGQMKVPQDVINILSKS